MKQLLNRSRHFNPLLTFYPLDFGDWEVNVIKLRFVFREWLQGIIHSNDRVKSSLQEDECPISCLTFRLGLFILLARMITLRSSTRVLSSESVDETQSNQTSSAVRSRGTSFFNLYVLRACLHGGWGPQVGEVTRLGGVTRLSIYSVIWSPHLSCKRNQIKLRDYMDRRVTPPKQGASPTWGTPPPCKQALSLCQDEIL